MSAQVAEKSIGTATVVRWMHRQEYLCY